MKAGQDAVVSDVYLIDLATYQSQSLFFFDHAYLELATMLRQMNQLGQRRWFDFVAALSRDGAGPTPEPQERGWLEDILASRGHAFKLAFEAYPDRMDDLRIQFLLAHVSAGLAFLHKVPRQGTDSGGLTPSQYRQSFIWSAVFLQQLLQLVGLTAEHIFPGETAVPVLGQAAPTEGPAPSETDWARVRHFDANGFNVLVLPNGADPIPLEIVELPWALIVDFREQAPADSELRNLSRPFRQTWPGEQLPDPKLLTRAGIWYFANGRTDLSGVEPATAPAEWRRRYRRSLDDLLVWISETVSPVDVRGLILGDGFAFDQLRMVVEGLDTAFHSALAPIVVTSRGGPPQAFDGILTIPSALDAVIVALRGARAASPPSSDTAFLPRRHGADISLAAMAYRVRMEQRLREARNNGQALVSVEDAIRADFQQAVDHFGRSTDLKPGNEHGLVATVQTASTLLRLSAEIAKASDLGAFLRQSSSRWYLEALALAEESIDNLRNRPHVSIRAKKTIAEWDLVYGRVDKVVADLRALASRHEDLSVRRALCVAIVARAKIVSRAVV